MEKSRAEKVTKVFSISQLKKKVKRSRYKSGVAQRVPGS